MAEIETDVDKLVKLVKEKKSVSLSDASRYLKLSPYTLLELAEFLEDEGIVDIEYKLAKPFIIDKGLGHKKRAAALLKKETVAPVTAPVSQRGKPSEKLGYKKGYKEKLRAGLLEISRDAKTISYFKSHFEELLKRHDRIEEELKNLARENYVIKKEINTLLRKFALFSITPKKQNFEKETRDMQMQFNRIRAKKQHFEEELSRFEKFMEFKNP